MLGRSRIVQLLKEGAAGKEEGIGVVPSPVGFTDSQVGGASLDLRLGRWFLSIKQSKRSELDLSRDDDVAIEDADGKYYFVPFGQKFVVHPNRFVLAITLEWLKLPKHIGAYITGKSSLGRRGLIIETASGVQPGFAGCLALEIANCGEIPIAVVPGTRIAQLFFHEIDGDSGEQPTQFNGTRKPIIGRFKRDVEEKHQQPGLPLENK